MGFNFLVLTIGIAVIELSNTQEIDPNLKFSDMVDTLRIGRHFENLTVYHPLYEGIAYGTLSTIKFQVLIQQDHKYVTNMFWSIRKLAEREEVPERKKYLQEICSEEAEKGYDNSFQIYYDKFHFTKAVQFLPTTLDYSSAQYTAAINEHIGVALATMYPCYTVWNKMGAHLGEIGNFSNDNPYIEFLKSIVPTPGDTSVQKFINFTNGYYDRMNSTILKRKMINAYVRSVELEYAFANANYMGKEIESTPPPKFTDLFETISPDFQNQFIHHPLFEEIALGKLPLTKYATLIQQDLPYLRSYYQAYSDMEAKEWNFTRKEILLKDPNDWGMEQWFKNQSDYYGFDYAVNIEPYTEGFIELTLNVGESDTNLEGMAVTYPAKILWIKMAEHIVKLADLDKNPNQPYKDFIQLLTPGPTNNLNKIQGLLNEYYEEVCKSGNIGLQHRAIDLARNGIFHELQFANGIYGIADNDKENNQNTLIILLD